MGSSNPVSCVHLPQIQEDGYAAEYGFLKFNNNGKTQGQTRIVSQRNASGEGSHLWTYLSQAGLTEINPEDLPSRIERTRNVVIEHLLELLEKPGKPVECEPAASTIGTLTELRRRVRPKTKSE